MGKAPYHDVAAEPGVTLYEAMQAAETRDRIAWNYTHGFVDIFKLGLKWLDGGTKRWGPVAWVTTYVYLGFLAHIPDTLIERKFGGAAASEVRDEARPIESGTVSLPRSARHGGAADRVRRLARGTGAESRELPPI